MIRSLKDKHRQLTHQILRHNDQHQNGRLLSVKSPISGCLVIIGLNADCEDVSTFGIVG
jgi:hypothetical protein